MHSSADGRNVLLSAMDRVIDRKEMACRQSVDPVDSNSLVAKHLKCWTGVRTGVCPNFGRRQITVQSLRDLGHRYFVVGCPLVTSGWLSNRGNRKSVYKSGKPLDASFV